MASKFARYESDRLQHVMTIARGVKYASAIWTNWNSNWERSGPSWIMTFVVIAAAFVSSVVDSSIFCTCCYQLDSSLEFLLVTMVRSTCAMSISSFTRYSWDGGEVENVYIILQQLYSENGVRNFVSIPRVFRRYYKNISFLYLNWLTARMIRRHTGIDRGSTRTGGQLPPPLFKWGPKYLLAPTFNV